MPTIQQLVRKGRTKITKKSKSAALDRLVLSDVVCVRVFTRRLQKNQTQQCVK